MANCIPKSVAMATSLSTYGLPSNTRFLWRIQAHNPSSISIISAVFVQLTPKCPYTLQWDTPFASKLPLSIGGSGPPSNTWFPVPTWLHNPNSISIGSAIFAGLTSVTDWPTDRPHSSVGKTGRIYVRSTAMRPNKNNNNINDINPLSRQPG